ncbi:MAG: heavy-metal-associated domain-containing protein [Planctomycetaceae bacterium]|nr:heavy-metal-associated domain-containing protein [Planctomycetaceae bacterium]
MHSVRMCFPIRGLLVTALTVTALEGRVLADDAREAPTGIRHQITGLFMPEREGDLREAVALVPGVKLLAIDYPNAEATFDYDAARVFPGAKPEQIVERFDQKLREASRSTFGVKPLRSMPLEKLKRVEVPVAGLDCKACALSAYESVYRLPGVELATASFKDGKVTALIDPEKIDEAGIARALKQRGVTLKSDNPE